MSEASRVLGCFAAIYLVFFILWPILSVAGCVVLLVLHFVNGLSLTWMLIPGIALAVWGALRLLSLRG